MFGKKGFGGLWIWIGKKGELRCEGESERSVCETPIWVSSMKIEIATA